MHIYSESGKSLLTVNMPPLIVSVVIVIGKEELFIKVNYPLVMIIFSVIFLFFLTMLI